MLMKSEFIWPARISPKEQVLVALVVCLNGPCKKIGLPCAGHSWLCNESTSGHSWAHQQNVWQPWQNIFNKGRKCQKGRDGKKKPQLNKTEKKPLNPQNKNNQKTTSQKNQSSKHLATPKSEMKEEETFRVSMVEKMFPAKYEGPMLEQGKGVRRKEQQRGAAVYWPYSTPLDYLEEQVEASAVRERS